MASSRTRQLKAPMMLAFRAAHESHDAKVRVDQRDASGERVIAGRRAAGRAAVTEAVVQRAVAQDFELLMNTTNLAASIDLTEHAAVRRSILNFGFPDIVHRTIDEGSVGDISHEIESALASFEPRLIPASVSVKRDQTADAAALSIRFIVRADIDCDPLNVPVEFVADLERDTGKMTINRR